MRKEINMTILKTLNLSKVYPGTEPVVAVDVGDRAIGGIVTGNDGDTNEREILAVGDRAGYCNGGSTLCEATQKGEMEKQE